MTKKVNKPEQSGNVLLAVFGCATAVWVVFTVGYAWLVPVSKSFWALAPNEYGDFFAGFFAPLAFGAVAVAVVLQRHELQAQRMELQQTRELQVPERQKQRIDDHMSDLFRLMFQLKELMRVQVGRSAGTGNTFTGFQRLLNEHLPEPVNKLAAFGAFGEMVDQMQVLAPEASEQFGSVDWFTAIRRKLKEIKASLRGLDELMRDSGEVRFSIQSYRDPIQVCLRETVKLDRLLDMYSPQLQETLVVE